MILNPNEGEDHMNAAVQRVQEHITTRGGEIEKVDTWGRRRMYYPVKHVRDGHYVIYTFKAEPQRVAELENAWRISEDVLRHLVVRQDS